MAVACGLNYTITVDENGAVFAFGMNLKGGLGLDHNDDVSTPTRIDSLNERVRQVSAGWGHTGMVTDAGDLFMCGHGQEGALGLGNLDNEWIPTKVPREKFHGSEVLMVACGYFHTVVVTTKGTVYTFGKGSQGSLGHGNNKDSHTPLLIPQTAFNDEQIVMVAAANYFSVALSETGKVFTWGNNNSGQLGHGNYNDQPVPREVDFSKTYVYKNDPVVYVACNHESTAAVTKKGNMYTWGLGDGGQLGNSMCENEWWPELVSTKDFMRSKKVMAAVGEQHMLAVTEDGALWVCGDGESGQLGLQGNKKQFKKFKKVGPVFGGAKVVAAAAGSSHSAVVTTDGRIWTFGENEDGQLGHEDVESCDVPTCVNFNQLHSSRMGRFHESTPDNVLAFTMGTHDRLGADSIVKMMREKELACMIANFTLSPLRSTVGEHEGVKRLLGLPSHGYRLTKQ